MARARSAWCGLIAWSAAWAVAWAVTLGAAPPALAQTFKDKLKSEVREGMDEAREKRKRAEERERQEQAERERQEQAEREREERERAGGEKAPVEPREPAPAPKPAPDKPDKPDKAEPKESERENTISFTIGDVAEELSKPPDPNAPKLPVRVFGENLRIDLQLGFGYRGWYPQQYDAVDVDVGNFATWNVNVKAKIFKWLVLRRGYYEANGLSAPRTEEAAVTAQIGSYAPKAVWLLGVIGVQISKAWEPVVRYETRAFATRAYPRQNVCVVDRDASESDTESCPGTMGDLRIVSGFETLVLGVRYDHSRSGEATVTQHVRNKVPPLTFGLAYMAYRKPYQLTFDGVTLPEYLFDARFRGLGVAAGTELGGGYNRFFGGVDVQVGLAEVSLTNATTLNEIIPGDHLIGYVQGNAVLGYTWPILNGPPTLILVPQIEFGGASFFTFDTKVTEGEDGATLPVNWDILYSAQVSLLVPL